MSEATAGPAREAPDDDALRTLAAVAFGLPELRDGQLAGMAALTAGRDVLAVMPTGYGKSALYQVPALLLHRQHQGPIGRAGRDGLPAQSVLHYRSDLGLRRYFATHRPDEDALLAVLSILRDAAGPLPPQDLAAATGYPPRRLTGLLNQLQDTGAVTAAEGGYRLDPDADPAALVERAVALAAARERVDKSRIAMMRSYAETHRCRRQFLLGYFGEDLPAPCGNCDNCKDGSGTRRMPDDGAASTSGLDVFPLNSAVEHALWGPGLVMRHDDGLMTVLFEREGYKTLSREAVLASGLLTRLP